MDMESIGKIDTTQLNNATQAAKVPSVEPAHNTVAAEQATASGEGNMQEQKKEHTPSEATINDSVSRANRHMEHTRCEYSYHKETNRVSIKVINDDTDEVIREIPPEKSLDMLQKMWEMAGILVDEKR